MIQELNNISPVQNGGETLNKPRCNGAPGHELNGYTVRNGEFLNSKPDQNGTSQPTVAIIDDEAQLRRLLRVILEGASYKVVEAGTGKQGLTEVATRRPDVVILDLGLPDMTGIEVITQLREWTNVPIVILSAWIREEDKILALQTGADDYITKPFSTGELLARVVVARRRGQSHPVPSHQVGPIELDVASRRVKVNGNPIKLTGIEYALLRLFVLNAGKVLTHPQILRAVWGPEHVGRTQYLHVYMTHLRGKIEANPNKPELLVTETRVGYRLNNDAPVATGSC